MRYTLIFVLGFMTATFAYAQSSDGVSEDAAAPPATSLNTETPDPAREAAVRLTEKYALDSDQATEILAIQIRKQSNLAEIESLKTSNPPLYFNKLKSVQRGTKASIRRVLKTQAQQDLFQKTQSEQRRLRAEKQQELRAAGQAPLAIEEAILGIYFE